MFNLGEDISNSFAIQSVVLGDRKSAGKLLAHSGIDVNKKDVDGNTPLINVARLGNEGILKLLLEKEDIDVNATNNEVVN